MIKRRYSLIVFLMLVLSACGSNKDRLQTSALNPSDIVWGKDAVSPEQAEIIASMPVDPSYDSQKIIMNDAGRFNGHYSKFKAFDITQCDVVNRDPKNNSQTYQCTTDLPMDVFVLDINGRQTLRVGGNSNYVLPSDLSYIVGEKLEWRYNGTNEIVAVIAPHHHKGDRSGLRDRLAVIRLPHINGGSCYVQMVPADAKPSQWEKARQIADNIEQYSCL